MEEEKVKQIQQNEENNNNFSEKRIKEGNKLNENKISSSIDKVTLKIKPIFEILKLKEKDFKNLENIIEDVDKLYKIYKSMINSEKSDCIINKQKNIDIYEIIKKMKIPPEKRTMDDIYLIRKYIKTTKIESLFYNEIKIKGKLYNSCLLFFSMLFRFRFIQKGKILFRIGEQPDFFYLILEGKINILKPIPKIKTLSGHEYFLQLMEYRKNKENHLYSLCILENTLNFEIKKKDKDLIPYIYLIYRLKEIRKRKFVDFTNIFNLIGISPIDLGLNPEKVHSIGYIYKQSKQMRLRMPIITEEDLNKYKFIDDKENKKEVTIFEYENFLILDKNKYFGEHSYLGKSVRNATIKTEENCYLGYLDINLYNLNFFVAKKAIYDKKVNFLHSSFIFGKIDAKRFERKYFNFFISEKYENNDYIFNENSPCNYTYFIEEGTVELTSTKSILEIQILLKGLKEITSKVENKLIYDKIISSSSEIENYVSKKQMNKLLVLGKKNILGLESFYYQIPYLTNARVISPKAKIIKIDSEHLYHIINKSYECVHELESKVDNTIKIITKRLFGINNNKLKRIDRIIKLDSKFKLEKIENENQAKPKLIMSNPFVKRVIKKIKLKIRQKKSNLINTSGELKNISNLYENKTNKKNDFSLISNGESKIMKSNILLNSAVSKNRIDYNKKYLESSEYEKKLLKKIRKEMISLRKRKLFMINNINTNPLEKYNNNEKGTQINNEFKNNSLLFKKNGDYTYSLKEDSINFIKNEMSSKNDDSSFDFVTKINNINQNNLLDDNKYDNKESEDNKNNKRKSRNLPKIINKQLSVKNGLVSINSTNINSYKNKNKSTKDLNINFSYNNRVIKNYSFINKYIYKENNQLTNRRDPKEKYKIFDDYTKGTNQNKNTNRIGIEKAYIKKYIPKTIRSKDLVIKIKKYQEYRKKIQRKIEEMFT